jgi:hypothetical protein
MILNNLPFRQKPIINYLSIKQEGGQKAAFSAFFIELTPHRPVAFW